MCFLPTLVFPQKRGYFQSFFLDFLNSLKIHLLELDDHLIRGKKYETIAQYDRYDRNVNINFQAKQKKTKTKKQQIVLVPLSCLDLCTWSIICFIYTTCT